MINCGVELVCPKPSGCLTSYPRNNHHHHHLRTQQHRHQHLLLKEVLPTATATVRLGRFFSIFFFVFVGFWSDYIYVLSRTIFVCCVCHSFFKKTKKKKKKAHWSGRRSPHVCRMQPAHEWWIRVYRWQRISYWLLVLQEMPGKTKKSMSKNNTSVFFFFFFARRDIFIFFSGFNLKCKHREHFLPILNVHFFPLLNSVLLIHWFCVRLSWKTKPSWKTGTCIVARVQWRCRLKQKEQQGRCRMKQQEKAQNWTVKKKTKKAKNYERVQRNPFYYFFFIFFFFLFARARMYFVRGLFVVHVTVKN